MSRSSKKVWFVGTLALLVATLASSASALPHGGDEARPAAWMEILRRWAEREIGRVVEVFEKAGPIADPNGEADDSDPVGSWTDAGPIADPNG